MMKKINYISFLVALIVLSGYLVEDPFSHGKDNGGWLGAKVQSINAQLQYDLGLKNKLGVFVTDIEPNSPAANANIKSGDVITKYDGVVIEDIFHLMNLVIKTEITKRVEMSIIRNGKEQTLNTVIITKAHTMTGESVATNETVRGQQIIGEFSKNNKVPDEKSKSDTIFTAEASDKIDKIISELSSMNYRSNTRSKQERFIEIYKYELAELLRREDLFSEERMERIGIEESLKRYKGGMKQLNEMINKVKQKGKITAVKDYEMATDELLKALLIFKGQEPDELLRSTQETRANKVYETWDTISVGYTTYRVYDSWWARKLKENFTAYRYPEIYDNSRYRYPDAKFLIVFLNVRNNDKKPRTIPLFKLVDNNGSEYETSSKGSFLKDSIEVLDSLNPGVEKDGYIVFDVPEYHNYKLKVSGGYWSGDTALIKLSPTDVQKIREEY